MKVMLMLRVVVCLFAVLEASGAAAREPPDGWPEASSATGSFPIWPGPRAPNETAKIGPEVRVQDGTQAGCGVHRNRPCDKITNVSVPTLTPYLVRNGTGAAVVIAPGGGYAILAISKEGEDVARMYNSIGVSAFLLKYRVPARLDRKGLPHWWAPLQDAQRAVSLVKRGAIIGKWGGAVNASQVGFTGFSAGGHLTAHVSTYWRRGRACAVDSVDLESCHPEFAIFGYPWILLPQNKEPEYEGLTASRTNSAIAKAVPSSSTLSACSCTTLTMTLHLGGH